MSKMTTTLVSNPSSFLCLVATTFALVAVLVRADGYLPEGNNAFKNVNQRYVKKMQLVDQKDWTDAFIFDTQQTAYHGYTNFVDEEQGRQLGIVGAGAGGKGFRIGYDTNHQTGFKRNAVRLRSKAHFRDGLYVFTINKTPYSCGVWPSVFTQSERGDSNFRSEIDILEYANGMARPNALVIHTQATCDVSESVVNSLVQGDELMKTCTDRLGTNGRRGCGVYMDKYSANSFAVPKNMNKQQTILVMERSPHSINSWFWPTSEAPEELQKVTELQSISTRSLGKPNVSLPSFRTCTEDDGLDSPHVIVMMLEMCGSLPEFYWNKDGCSAKGPTCHGYHNSDAAGEEIKANGGGNLEFANFVYFAGNDGKTEDAEDKDSTESTEAISTGDQGYKSKMPAAKATPQKAQGNGQNTSKVTEHHNNDHTLTSEHVSLQRHPGEHDQQRHRVPRAHRRFEHDAHKHHHLRRQHREVTTSARASIWGGRLFDHLHPRAGERGLMVSPDDERMTLALPRGDLATAAPLSVTSDEM